MPANGRSIDELRAQEFTAALVVSASDRSYSEMRWSEARLEGDSIVVPAWAPLRSRNAGREITAGVKGESRQIFSVMVPASPKSVENGWSQWAEPRQRFDGSKPAPAEQYRVRYRVRFETEYSPTPSYTPDAEEPTKNDKSPPDESGGDFENAFA